MRCENCKPNFCIANPKNELCYSCKLKTEKGIKKRKSEEKSKEPLTDEQKDEFLALCSRPDWKPYEENVIPIRKLLESNSDYASCKAPNGSTPLHRAAHKDNVPLMKELRKHGGNINALTKSRWSSLHNAIIMQCQNVVEYILELKYKEYLDLDVKVPQHFNLEYVTDENLEWYRKVYTEWFLKEMNEKRDPEEHLPHASRNK
eukprot:m.229605 g.229605  ORF g.229605 m.229605 type:complete len:203 (-) comp15990_c1_seq2:124-732(-)